MTIMADVKSEGHLFGRSGKHVRVMVLTVTAKEMPVARSVFEALGGMQEIGKTRAFANTKFLKLDHVPFAVGQLTGRNNLKTSTDVNHWVSQFRPEAFILLGTAGAVCRAPFFDEDGNISGPKRGDVLFSEYVHYGDYMRISEGRYLQRYSRLDQPCDSLFSEAEAVRSDRSWHALLGPLWEGQALPRAHEVEILSTEQIRDDPLEAVQQYLMDHFDRAGAFEMESAGLASALHALHKDATYAPRYLAVRGCSDLAWARGVDFPLTPEALDEVRRSDQTHTPDARAKERDTWTPKAVAAAAAFTLALVDRIVSEEREGLQAHPVMGPTDLGLSEVNLKVKP